MSTPTPAPAAAQPDSDVPVDQLLANARDLAHTALVEDVGADCVGEYVDARGEAMGSGLAATHHFEAAVPGYRGWHWAVSVSRAEDSERVTINEIVLLPGSGAIRAAQWVPWSERLRPGDVHPGDLVPVAADDERLVPGYVLSDDPQVELVAREMGLGRERVLSREGRLDAAARWRNGQFGPATAMAKHAPAHCGTCGFFLPVAGSMQAMFGVCANEIAPADGRVVSVEFGCGAHSDVTMPPLTESAEGDLIYDTVGFDLDRLRHARGTAALSPERAELAAQILTRVLEHGLGRVAARQAAAVRQLTPQEVMAAVRAAFAQREPKSRPRTRLHRTKRH